MLKLSSLALSWLITQSKAKQPNNRLGGDNEQKKGISKCNMNK
jgi:hypothetical protein